MRTANPQLQLERRQQILQAAGTCFADKGFHQASMAEIARTAGLSMGLLYRYFANKEALVLAFAELSRAQSVAMFEALAGSANPQREIAAIVDAALGEALDPALLRLHTEVMAEACRNATLLAALQGEDAAARSALAAGIETLRARGTITPSLDSAALAELLTALFDGLLVRQAMQSDLDRTRLRDACLETISLWLGLTSER